MDSKVETVHHFARPVPVWGWPETEVTVGERRRIEAHVESGLNRSHPNAERPGLDEKPVKGPEPLSKEPLYADATAMKQYDCVAR